MNPTLREMLGWLRCPHRGPTQIQEEQHIAWRCDDCGLSRVKWIDRTAA